MSNNEKSIHFLNIQIILVLWKQGWTNPQHGALLWTDRNVFNFWTYFCLSNWRYKTGTSFGPGCDLTNLWPKHGEWILIFWYFSLPQLIYLMSIQFNRDSTHLHHFNIAEVEREAICICIPWANWVLVRAGFPLISAV